MKILYVEDELSRNIPYVIRLFSKHLGRERCEKLESLETDEYASVEHSEKIKAIVEDTDLVDVAYRFPDALEKIVTHHALYSLFIVDRNLTESEYYPQEVKAVDPEYGQDQYDEYFGYEGDYLLHKLAVAMRVDVMRRFYFLTSYVSGKTELRSHELKRLLDTNRFVANNFIRKGSDKGGQRLQQLINSIQILDLRNENRHYLKILRDNLDEKASYWFLHLLCHKDMAKTEVVAQNLDLLGNILEKMLAEAGNRLNAPPDCWNDQNALIIRNFLWHLTRDETGRKASYKFGTNRLMKSFLYAIYGITREHGQNDELSPDPSGYPPTENTVNALLYALKDIILWFGGICQKY